jgi:hypothetical protein
MELSTLSRQFLPVDVIEEFESIIWTERYYGDSEVQIIVPATPKNLSKLAIGTFLSFAETDEIMILETHSIQDNQATITGISLLKWLNNRFIRSSATLEDKYWYILGTPTTGGPVGQLLWGILAVMVASPDPEYANYPLGVPNPSQHRIYNIVATHIDQSGPNVTVSIPYGPLYDAMYEIATTYKVGMTLRLEETGVNWSLGFRSYIGADRTSGQSINPLVRFSPDMQSLANIKELQSISDHKTDVYAFPPPNALIGPIIPPGYATIGSSSDIGFDFRAAMTFEDDLTEEVVGSDAAYLSYLLNQRATAGLEDRKFVKMVDGEIVSTNRLKYGSDYYLGDIIEVQGHSGIIQTARVLEYIRSQDSAGEKAYPTLEMLS